MKNPLVFLGVALLVTVFVGVPAHGQGLEASAQARDPHHSEQGVAPAPSATTPEPRPHTMRMMSEMSAADTKLDELVQAMNTANGPEKTDAIATVVAALVKEHAAMRGSMAMMMNMMSMMNKIDKMDKMSAMGDTATGKPRP